ncbi:HDOD domain-containing protein [Xanthomonas oryzae pv. oryzae]|uniref:Predicted signal transduction protein n=1 Tax=Xanthomonas oryzae pv. oryzae (strain KACC10331 / KXO85) TaxID=291331 RepID=Q5H1E2_XANOR|nr:Predicted signal transduction protein [Xanthomonas oryzae pv. oryzae KACC 10331]QBN99027.1 HDOD domain-containing protein [Xanthomonas oryzae pv. oryzae]
MRSALPLLHDGDQAFGVYRAHFYRAAILPRGDGAAWRAPSNDRSCMLTVTVGDDSMQPDLQAALHYCRNLPSPPGIALRIIELAQDPDVDMTTTANVIGMDMALTARALSNRSRRCQQKNFYHAR